MKEYQEGDKLESIDGTRFILTSREASIINCVLEHSQFHGYPHKSDGGEDNNALSSPSSSKLSKQNGGKQ